MIELLVTVTTVAFLSVVAMGTYTEVSSSAQAAQVVNDMKTIKAAVMSWYLDNNMNRVIREEVEQDYRGTYKLYTRDLTEGPQFVGYYAHTEEGGAEFFSYINNGQSMTFEDHKASHEDREGQYSLRSENNGRWYVMYTFRENEDKLKEKLAIHDDAHTLIGNIVWRTVDGVDVMVEERFDPKKDNTVSMNVMIFE